MKQTVKRDINAMPFKEWLSTQIVVTDDDKRYVAWVKANPFDPKDDLSIPMFLRRTQSTIKDQWAKAPPPRPMPLFEIRKPAPEASWMSAAEVIADQKKRAAWAKAGAEQKAQRDFIRKVQGPRKTVADHLATVRTFVTRDGGATVDQMETEMKRSFHSGFITLLKKEGLNIERVKNAKGETVYRLAGKAATATAPKPGKAAPPAPKAKAPAKPDPKPVNKARLAGKVIAKKHKAEAKKAKAAKPAKKKGKKK